MRDIALALVFVAMLLGGVRHVYAASMVWMWTAMAAPNTFLFGFLQAMPLNKIAVGVALLALLADRAKRKFIIDPSFAFHSLFILQGTVTLIFSLTDIPRTYDLFDKMLKIWLLVCVMRVANRERLQLHALVIMLALSLGVHGVLEGFKYVLTFGSHKVQASGTLGDNNSFAMAMLMMLPFFAYLVKYSALAVMRWAFGGIGMLVMIGIIASASRGAVVGLVVLGGMMVMQSRHKAMGLLIAAALGIAVVSLAPTQWLDRMNTIQHAESDGSFMNRVASWKLNTIVALNRPLTGGGFSALEDYRVYQQFVGQFSMLDFIPSEQPSGVLAAHSIYFEVIGDTGLVGFVLFLSIMASWYLNLRQVKRLSRAGPALAWARDLAVALEQSLIVYLVTGAALSAAYFENVYIEATLASMLLASVRETVQARVLNPLDALMARRPAVEVMPWAQPRR